MGSRATTPPVAPLGGGGLCATAGDYVRFAEMLRGRGELDGVRILAPKTVELMASNHLPGNADLTAIGRPLFAETTFDGVGFGLGVSVTIDPVKARVPGSVGDFGWGGAASTSYWVDPVEDLSVRVDDPAAAEQHPPAAQPAEAAGARGAGGARALTLAPEPPVGRRRTGGMERAERTPPARRTGSRLTRVLAVIGRGALFMAGGAGVLWIGALPPVLAADEDDEPRPCEPRVRLLCHRMSRRDVCGDTDQWLPDRSEPVSG